MNTFHELIDELRVPLDLDDRCALQALAYLDHPYCGDVNVAFDAKDAFAACPPWVPIYVVPFGALRGGTIVGFDLCPENRDAGRLAVVECLEPTFPVSLPFRSLREYLAAKTLEQEVYAQGHPETRGVIIHDAMRIGCETWGPSFWKPHSTEQIAARHQTLWEQGLRSLAVTRQMARTHDDPEIGLQTLARAIERYDDPAPLEALLALADPDVSRLASAYLYTGTHWDWQTARGRARGSDDDVPGVDRLRAEGGDALLALAASAADVDEHAVALRALCDYGTITEDHDALVTDHYRPAFEALGWDWALTICGLRAPAPEEPDTAQAESNSDSK